jgi:succinate dehydrogenase / fumarate reductase cytochrome b subunit
MLRSIGNALASSVGRKAVVGLTGLLLVGFLLEHLFGNAFLYFDADGSAFNGYVASLKLFGPFLLVAELGLALLFAIHIYLAIRLTLENREARKQGYAVRATRGQATPASLSMHVSGALLLAYTLKHLWDFRFNHEFHEAPAATVKETLSTPFNAVVYLAAAVLVGWHLSHGFRSAFQSLGLSRPGWGEPLKRLGYLIAAVLAVGFASFPIYYLFVWSQGGANG